MRRRCLLLAVVLGVLLPGALLAQERWLRGIVVSIGEQNERLPEVSVTVTIQESGDRTTTDSHGTFRIFLPEIFKTGEKVTLVVDKPGWRIQYPLEGEARIPADLRKELVEVRLLPVGSKLFLSHAQLEKLIQDMAEKSTKQVTSEDRPGNFDLSRYIKDWATRYGFSVQEVKDEIDHWIAEVETNQNDLYKLGLAAFAKKNFGEASKLFNESAEYKARKLEQVRQAERSLAEEVIRDFRLTGDAHYNNYLFEQALSAYTRALSYVSQEQTPRLWAEILIDVGNANSQIGIRTRGVAVQEYLNSAVAAYQKTLEVYTRETLPQQWATTQNNLGAALAEQGLRTGGEAGQRLLAEAVAAYRQALKVRTREALPLQWAQTYNNLAEAYWYLEDWSNAATSYANVLHVYPDYEKAYRTASFLYHERLFNFPQAFALNQQWLERHPEDISALSNFAEKHFTTGRFAACAQRIVALLERSDVESGIKIALQIIEIANLFALHKAEAVPGKVEQLHNSIASQAEDFTIDWAFNGVKHVISQHETLVPYRPWLLRFFSAVEGKNRQAILTALQEVQADFRPFPPSR